MERISSNPSRESPNGDPTDDRSCSKADPDNLPLGEEEQATGSECSAEINEIVPGGEVVTPDFGKVGSTIGEPWLRSENFVLGGTIGSPGEKDGRGLTGVALSGDVMDSVGEMVTLEIGNSYSYAAASTRGSCLIDSNMTRVVVRGKVGNSMAIL